jgi:hypothetical protein
MMAGSKPGRERHFDIIWAAVKATDDENPVYSTSVRGIPIAYRSATIEVTDAFGARCTGWNL